MLCLLMLLSGFCFSKVSENGEVLTMPQVLRLDWDLSHVYCEFLIKTHLISLGRLGWFFFLLQAFRKYLICQPCDWKAGFWAARKDGNQSCSSGKKHVARRRLSVFCLWFGEWLSWEKPVDGQIVVLHLFQTKSEQYGGQVQGERRSVSTLWSHVCGSAGRCVAQATSRVGVLCVLSTVFPLPRLGGGSVRRGVGGSCLRYWVWIQFPAPLVLLPSRLLSDLSCVLFTNCAHKLHVQVTQCCFLLFVQI